MVILYIRLDLILKKSFFEMWLNEMKISSQLKGGICEVSLGFMCPPPLFLRACSAKGWYMRSKSRISFQIGWTCDIDVGYTKVI